MSLTATAQSALLLQYQVDHLMRFDRYCYSSPGFGLPSTPSTAYRRWSAVVLPIHFVNGFDDNGINDLGNIILAAP